MNQDKIELGKYRHYKTGNEYEVIGMAHHSETLEPLVVYRALYESKDFGLNAIWVRPLKMFTEKVMRDGKKMKRFEKIA
ncbi:MAG: DUF1653 domain-containing protein [Patescibacteria group bacterium]